MKTAYDVDANDLIARTAEALETEYDAVEMPEWARYVKTGVHKERPPRQENWWYLRSAAVLRKIYANGPLGTRRLRNMYGGKQNRGHKTEHKAKGSGKVLRTVLQQLDDAGLVTTEEGKGRSIAPDGQRLLDGMAKDVAESDE